MNKILKAYQVDWNSILYLNAFLRDIKPWPVDYYKLISPNSTYSIMYIYIPQTLHGLHLQPMSVRSTFSAFNTLKSHHNICPIV